MPGRDQDVVHRLDHHGWCTGTPFDHEFDDGFFDIGSRGGQGAAGGKAGWQERQQANRQGQAHHQYPCDPLGRPWRRGVGRDGAILWHAILPRGPMRTLLRNGMRGGVWRGGVGWDGVKLRLLAGGRRYGRGNGRRHEHRIFAAWQVQADAQGRAGGLVELLQGHAQPRRLDAHDRVPASDQSFPAVRTRRRR